MDEDGDILVKRNNATEDKLEATMILEHQLSTDLANVGMQMWRGAFYLADYLIHLCIKNSMHEVFYKSGGVWLELGAGVGLLSIVSSLIQPKSVERRLYSTDLLEVIPLTQRNIVNNVNGASDLIEVFALDIEKCSIPTKISESSLELILAADLIYDNHLTKCIVKTLHLLILQELLRHESSREIKGSKSKILTCLFSIEKRFNFTIQDLEVTAPAYDYFIKCLDELSTNMRQSHMGLDIIYKSLDTNISQAFCYERCKNVIIIQIDVIISNQL